MSGYKVQIKKLWITICILHLPPSAGKRNIQGTLGTIKMKGIAVILISLIISCQSDFSIYKEFYDKDHKKIKSEGFIGKMNSLKTGYWKNYYENGKLMSEGKYNGNTQYGIWKLVL